MILTAMMTVQGQDRRARGAGEALSRKDLRGAVCAPQSSKAIMTICSMYSSVVKNSAHSLAGPFSSLANRAAFSKAALLIVIVIST